MSAGWREDLRRLDLAVYAAIALGGSRSSAAGAALAPIAVALRRRLKRRAR
jgi:hypothetical protein